MRMLRLADHEPQHECFVDRLAALDHASQRLVLRLAFPRSVPNAGDDDRGDETPEGERREPCSKSVHTFAPQIDDLYEARCGAARFWMRTLRPSSRSTMVPYDGRWQWPFSRSTRESEIATGRRGRRAMRRSPFRPEAEAGRRTRHSRRAAEPPSGRKSRPTRRRWPRDLSPRWC